ncbi:MAG: hypothetical protein KDA78_09340 [Planctomycetaceae bacterium]|nr:hypothetical protein [Planctomycetaceae bacterium]
MIIDIREDLPDFLAYIQERVEEHIAGTKDSESSKPVTYIEFGFEFGQGNELWLVIDTRPNAEPDGQWTQQIGKIRELGRPHWPIWHDLPDDEVVYFIDLNGNQINVMDNPDEQICEIIGEAMKQALLTSRDNGVFRALPTAEACELAVENLEGFYGWPIYADRGKENLLQENA